MKNLILFSFLGLFFLACSTSKEVSKEDEKKKGEEEIYIFDDADVKSETKKDVSVLNKEIDAVISKDKKEVDEADTSDDQIENPYGQQVTSNARYYLQLGAFTTRERALNFVEENKMKLSYPLEIEWSEKVSLFTVSLPPFESRTAVERVRSELWARDLFKDAFIVTK